MSTRHGGSGGAIVNVSSAASRLGAPGQYVDYAAAKGAIDTFTIGLAKEVAAEGIRVNAVRPGPDRDRDPRLGRPARPRARAGAPGADAARRHGRGSGRGDRLAAVAAGQLHHHVAARRFGRPLMSRIKYYWEDLARRLGARPGHRHALGRGDQGLSPGSSTRSRFTSTKRPGAAFDLRRPVRQRLAHLRAGHEAHGGKFPARVVQHGLARAGKPALAQARLSGRHAAPAADHRRVAGPAHATRHRAGALAAGRCSTSTATRSCTWRATACSAGAIPPPPQELAQLEPSPARD